MKKTIPVKRCACRNEEKLTVKTREKQIKYLFSAAILFPSIISFPKKKWNFLFLFSIAREKWLKKKTRAARMEISRFSRFRFPSAAITNASRGKNWFSIPSKLYQRRYLCQKRLARQVDNEPRWKKNKFRWPCPSSEAENNFRACPNSSIKSCCSIRNLIFLSLLQPFRLGIRNIKISLLLFLPCSVLLRGVEYD